MGGKAPARARDRAARAAALTEVRAARVREDEGRRVLVRGDGVEHLGPQAGGQLALERGRVQALGVERDGLDDQARVAEDVEREEVRRLLHAHDVAGALRGEERGAAHARVDAPRETAPRPPQAEHITKHTCCCCCACARAHQKRRDVEREAARDAAGDKEQLGVHRLGVQRRQEVGQRAAEGGVARDEAVLQQQRVVLGQLGRRRRAHASQRQQRRRGLADAKVHADVRCRHRVLAILDGRGHGGGAGRACAADAQRAIIDRYEHSS